MKQEPKEYETYFMTLKDETKKPIQRLVRDKRLWLKKYQLTVMRRRVAVEISFTANYRDLGMLQFVIERYIGNSCNYCLPQLSEAIDNARKRVEEITEAEYNAGRYSDWIDEYGTTT
jgi:hypothetical protein